MLLFTMVLSVLESLLIIKTPKILKILQKKVAIPDRYGQVAGQIENNAKVSQAGLEVDWAWQGVWGIWGSRILYITQYLSNSSHRPLLELGTQTHWKVSKTSKFWEGKALIFSLKIPKLTNFTFFLAYFFFGEWGELHICWHFGGRGPKNVCVCVFFGGGVASNSPH